jgi:hypothetical protein
MNDLVFRVVLPGVPGQWTGRARPHATGRLPSDGEEPGARTASSPAATLPAGFAESVLVMAVLTMGLDVLGRAVLATRE